MALLSVEHGVYSKGRLSSEEPSLKLSTRSSLLATGVVAMALVAAACGGGAGPNSFDALAALERWVEDGHAPDSIEAALRRDGAVVRTRPLCPYPQQAAYTGGGSTDDARNFTCRMR